MSGLTARDVATGAGVVRLWGPAAPAPLRPIVVGIQGTLASHDEMTALLGGLSIFADGYFLRLPGGGAAPLASFALRDIAGAVGEAIETAFPDRPVVLIGVSAGAVVALGVRARNLARVVAVEPPLSTGEAWPVHAPLRAHLASNADPAGVALVREAFGVTVQGVEDRDHGWVLEGLAVPVDVVLGAEPLEPRRTVPRFPSLLGEAQRRRLAATPGVRLHLAEGTGHNALGQAPAFVRDVLLEACRRASAPGVLKGPHPDEALLEATPAIARRVLHWGGGGAAFSKAFLAASPLAEIEIASDEPAPSAAPEGFDVVVLARPAPERTLAALAGSLAQGGHLVARWAGPREDLARSLAPHGLALREPVDAAGTGVIRAQKLPPGRQPTPALMVQTTAYATLLMDIRTRLPTRGLRSDPELQVVYTSSPVKLRPLAREAPKVVVLQRTAAGTVESWRPFLAEAMRAGWIVVVEFDDHPLLIKKVKGLPSSEADMAWLAYAHAVQTSTPPLVEAFGAYNPEVVMFENAAFDILPFPHGPRPKKVFYGGVIRGAHAQGVAAALGPAIAAHPDAEFHVIGDRAVLDALPTSNKRYYDYMSFEAYLGIMADCAISLSPIVPEPMRDTKSDAKFLDAARAGALTIASPTIYDRVIEHGVNGLLAPEAADWAPLLSRALSEPAWREAMAHRAWTYVRETRMFTNQIVQRRAWYQDLWARRAELDEALMDRVPGLRELVRS